VFKVALVDVEPGINPIPPSAVLNDKALGFKIIKPTSGRNLPYEPDFVYPAVIPA
jgi:hypothetical protein